MHLLVISTSMEKSFDLFIHSFIDFLRFSSIFFSGYRHLRTETYTQKHGLKQSFIDG